MLKKILFVMISVTSAFAFHIGELNINNKDIEAQLRFDMGQFNEQVDPHTTFLGLRYINADRDHSDYNKDPELFELNALMQREVGTLPELTLGLGVKLDLTDLGDEDYLAMPLGMEASYRLATDDFIPIHIGAHFYYAPEVLSFRDAKRYLEYKVDVDLELIPNGFITGGYRHIEVKYEHGSSQKLNAAWFLGFKVYF